MAINFLPQKYCRSWPDIPPQGFLYSVRSRTGPTVKSTIPKFYQEFVLHPTQPTNGHTAVHASHIRQLDLHSSQVLGLLKIAGPTANHSPCCTFNHCFYIQPMVLQPTITVLNPTGGPPASRWLNSQSLVPQPAISPTPSQLSCSQPFLIHPTAKDWCYFEPVVLQLTIGP